MSASDAAARQETPATPAAMALAPTDAHVVRTATPADDAGLIRLWARSFDAPLMPAFWALDSARYSRTLVVQVGETVGAALYLVPTTVVGCAGELTPIVGLANVASDPDMRGRGLVRSLLGQAGCFVAAGQYAGGLLFTNTPGVYRAAGWQPVTLRYTQLVPSSTRGLDAGGAARAAGVTVRPGSWLEWADLAVPHHQLAAGFPMTTVRDELHWRRTALWLADASLVVASRAGRVVGYLAWRTVAGCLELCDGGGDPTDVELWRTLMAATLVAAPAWDRAPVTCKLPPAVGLAQAWERLGLVASWTLDHSGMVTVSSSHGWSLQAMMSSCDLHHFPGDYF